MSLLRELQRRNVFRVGIAYAIAVWVLLQITDVITPILALPDWAPKLIFVILAIGFVPAVIFAWAFEMTPDGLKKEKDVDRDLSITRSTGQKLNVVIIASLVLAVGFLFYDRTTAPPVPVSVSSEAAEARSETEKPLDSGLVSIAVLPFINMSSDPEQEYFSDGLAEEILNVLVRVKGLSVTSRTSAFAYKGENRNVSIIADELGVEHVLEGSVRRAGNRVRIHAKLIYAANDRHLWSEVYDRELEDVFAIQDEIATAIGRALQLQLVDIRGNTLTVAGTDNTAAHNAYLRGRYFLHQRGNENVARAVELFEEAIVQDTEFAQAYASLAYAKSIGWGQLDPEGAASHSARALELDPALPEAILAAGSAAQRQFRFEEAESFFKELLTLEPRNANALHAYGSFLNSLGRHTEAVPLAERAVALDPTSAIMRVWLGNSLISLGQVHEGKAHLNAAMEIGQIGTGYLIEWKAVTGDTAGAIALIEALTDESVLNMDDSATLRAFALVAAGRIDEARMIVAGKNIGQTPDGSIAIVYAYLGEIEQANRMLQSMIEIGLPLSNIHDLLKYMPGHPMGKTRYNELRASIGLPGLDED